MRLKRLSNAPSMCPNCGKVLSSKPTRKVDCPHCGETIRVRKGELITEEDLHIHEWIDRLEFLGVSITLFNRHRDELSRQFGFKASVNDTVWRILNSLIVEYASDKWNLEFIYREMAALVSKEGKDPTEYLKQAESIRTSDYGPTQATVKDMLFLGHDELAYVRSLRNKGDFQKAEDLLYKAEPSAAVLDELRKVSSARAKLAKKNGDWKSVVEYLAGYESYATEKRDYCVKMVNQEPPEHTASDKKLLAEARSIVDQ